MLIIYLNKKIKTVKSTVMMSQSRPELSVDLLQLNSFAKVKTQNPKLSLSEYLQT